MKDNSTFKWEQVVNSIKESVILLDKNGIITNCNASFLKMIDLPSTKVIGANCYTIIPDEDGKPENCPYLKSKRSKKRESSIIKRGDKWFEVDADPILDGENEISGFVQFMSDTTERKRLQESLINSEERYRSLSEATFQAIFISEKGVCIEQNSIAEKMFGYTLSEAIGRNGTEWIAPEYREIVMNNMLSGYEKSYEAIALRKDGSTFPAEIQGKMMPYKGKTVRVTALMDITERNKAEQALKENEKRYKYLFNQSPTSIWEEDFSEVHRYLTSLKKSGIKDFKEYFEHHLDEVKKCSEMVRIVDINEMTLKLFNAKSKEDLITNLDSIFTEVSLSPFIDQLCAIAENQTCYDGETVNKTLDGELLNVFIRLSVVPGYERDYSRVLISLMDVTVQKKAEEGLRLGRERLKLLNQIIRHDLSNDFIVIKSAVNIFRRSSEVKMIEEIERRADKSLATIDTYRKYESFIDSNADLNKIEAVELINDIIIEFPKIKFTIEGKCNVFADDALTSIFTNLITNSIKHGNASAIDIKISTENNMCEIMFADNGTGIPDKIKNKIFNEGFF
ncbi:MAG: PAS domain-containing sensor histidine kinase, partial [FCB group bacterium]|nr:PAS domain-containing sensor histidine kinase [FCB group bacterium]